MAVVIVVRSDQVACGQLNYPWLRSNAMNRQIQYHAPLEHNCEVAWALHVMPLKYPGLQEVGLRDRLVEQDVQKLIEAGFTSQPVCVVGNPAEEILDVAAIQHADLIVLGAKGLSGIDRFLLGSVSTRVVQHAKGAVLVVR